RLACAPRPDTLSLHDALPISLSEKLTLRRLNQGLDRFKSPYTVNKYLRDRGDERVYNWETFVANSKFQDDEHRAGSANAIGIQRSEEHTSELQSREKLVCRLL